MERVISGRSRTVRGGCIVSPCHITNIMFVAVFTEHDYDDNIEYYEIIEFKS